MPCDDPMAFLSKALLTAATPLRCPQVAEFDNCRILLVDKKISTARDMVRFCLSLQLLSHSVLPAFW